MNFKEIVETTEQIKDILRISDEITLKAINARLIARQSGESARGFRVVSEELRRFSRSLESSMAEIMDLVSNLVAAVATSRRHDRMAGYYRNLASNDDCGERIHDVVLQHEYKKVALNHLILDLRGRLQVYLVQARRACAAGAVIARAARIEAVHGGALAVQLTQVAKEVEVTVGCIEDAIKIMEKSFLVVNNTTGSINEEVAVDLSARRPQMGSDCPRPGEAGLRDRHQRVRDRPWQGTAHY